jgi:VanZ family protein
LTRTLSLWGPVALWMGAIFYASSQSHLALPPGLTDKPTHLLVYTALGTLLVRALTGGLRARVTLSTALLAMALTTAYGVTDEIHQMFVPGRYAEWRDLVADSLGGALGAFTCWLWGIIRQSRAASRDASRHGL